MRMARTLGVIATLLPLLSCTTSIQTDFDHQADFGSYSTFAWYQEAEKSAGPTGGKRRLERKSDKARGKARPIQKNETA